LSEEEFTRAFDELVERTNKRLIALGVAPVALSSKAVPAIAPVSGSAQSITRAYGAAISAAARRRPEIVVFDADLSADCGLRELERTLPGQFVEHGIAEQDMVSTAGAIARAGFLPVVNSFAAFLASRANEQIYNNATERTRLIYAFHYAGLLPAAAGSSHQSVRDIALAGTIPGVIIVQPCNEEETRMAVEFCCSDATQTSVLRLAMGSIEEPVRLPDDYTLCPGRGAMLRDGHDVIVLSYGPRMLAAAIRSSEILASERVGCRVVNMPWLNYVDPQWLVDVLEDIRLVVVVEDHAPVGGLGDCLLRAAAGADLLGGRVVRVLGVEGIPECGMPDEVLKYHGLDESTLAARIRSHWLCLDGGLDSS
jgi:transketolase